MLIALRRRTGLAIAATTFRPRVLRGLPKVETATTLLGRPLEYPLVLAPTGFTRIADPQGELAVARAAERAGLPYTLSTYATTSIGDVARAAPGGRNWFQLYLMKDRDVSLEHVRQAREPKRSV